MLVGWPQPGHRLVRPDLAVTLSAIADKGRSAFYEGRVAEQITAATGGILTVGDLVDNRPDWVDPVGASVFGLEAWTVPPNSQGYLTVAADNASTATSAAGAVLLVLISVRSPLPFPRL